MDLISHKNKIKIGITAVLIAAISFLHYSTPVMRHYRHIFYQELYFLPLLLAAFWFGLRGAITASLSVTAVYAPFIAMHWQHFSPDDFARLVETLLFNVVAVVLGILRDRERNEQQRLREAECLATMGRALSAVAHDMKTPLIAIGGFTRLAQKKLPSTDPIYEKLDIVVHETQRLENMVKDMLDFAKPLELNPEPVNLNDVVRECLAIVDGAAASSKIRIDTNLTREVPPVICDTMRIKQVMINLLMNAIQASSENESILIQTRREDGEVMIDVTDAGSGIPEDKEQEIFTPFFTTKKDGTGLGLPIARKILEAHHGQLLLLRNPQRGVTFRVVLPMRRHGGTKSFTAEHRYRP